MAGKNSLFDSYGNRKYLNEKERELFLQHARSLTSLRDRSFSLVLYYTGCRISEALACTKSQFDLSNKTLIIRTLKQKDKIAHRAIPLPPELIKELKAQCKASELEHHIWEMSRSTGWRVIKQVMKLAKIEGTKAVPHGLRHSFAVMCAKKNIALPKIQQWLGHSSLSSVSTYLNFVGDDDRDLAKRLWK